MAGKKVKSVSVASTAELNQAVAQYMEKGYTTQTHTPEMATMVYNTSFNFLIAGVLLLACIVPGLVYILYVGSKSGDQVIIRVDAAGGDQAMASGGDSSGLTWSDDRRFWWDGSVWVDAEVTSPPGAPISDDGSLWWDGVAWRPVAVGPADS